MGNNKPNKAATLTASLLARKGEAIPAASATAYTDPGLAWGDPAPDTAGGLAAKAQAPAKPPHPTPKTLVDVKPDETVRARTIPSAQVSTVQAQPAQAQPAQAPAPTPVAVQPRATVSQTAAPIAKPMPPVTSQIRASVTASAVPPAKTTAPRRATSKSVSDRVAVTLRLDDDRYLRLKIFSARSKRTNQDILQTALDGYLDQLALDGHACPCMAKTNHKAKN